MAKKDDVSPTPLPEAKKEITPFVFLNSVTDNKEYLGNDSSVIKEYNKYVVNKGLSLFSDTVMYANEMNLAPDLSLKAQYDFYYHGIRKARRWSKWPKKVDRSADHQLIREHYGYNDARAEEVLNTLNEEQMDEIRSHHEK